jgi:predicted nucleotide-binding protein (sugar kinase/HSP70/actin superfamily)
MEKETSKIKKVCFPHMGHYFLAFKEIVEPLAEIIPPPPITKKTVELGTRYGPESACIPFKYNLGNYIEALDKGANFVIQAGGGCRFGYYGEVQEEILKKLGYEFEFFKFPNDYNFLTLARALQKINPKVSITTILYSLGLAYFKIRAIDKIEDYIRLNIGFEIEKGEFEKTFKLFLRDLGKDKKILRVRGTQARYLKLFKNIKLNKPENPIRVVILGEVYVVMEPFSNFSIEKQLGEKGVEVHRHSSLSTTIHDLFFNKRVMKEFLAKAAPYLKNDTGAHGTETVGLAHHSAKAGFDGAIHIKPFGCMPEVNAMSALHRISHDYKFPIIYFSFDSQTSETGVKTRLEAFYDLLIMKKQKNEQPR